MRDSAIGEELQESGMNPKGNGTEMLPVEGPLRGLDSVPTNYPFVPWLSNGLLTRVCGNLKDAEILARDSGDPYNRKAGMRRISDSMHSYNWQVRSSGTRV